MGKTRQRVGINAHLLSGRHGYRRAGIHHYIAQLLRHLPPAERLAYTVFTREPVDLPGATLVATRWPTERPLARIAWEQLAWPVTAVRRRLDLLHSLAFVTPWASPCPTIVTVYDLSFVHYPDRFPLLQRVYLTGQTRRSCRTARRVVTISESGRQDVHRLFGVPLDRIDVVAPGVDPAFCPREPAEVAAFRRREQLPERFILHVGTLQPRKNIPLLLEAFGQLLAGQPAADGLLLVLVGGRGWMYDEIFDRVEALGLRGRVRFAGYVADEALPLWYNAATLLAFPSVYEGFGMPVAQAMACGTPVVAANASAIPEATGEAALLFDPQDAAALAERMRAVLDDPALAATMRRDGLDQARGFSWAQSGRTMAAIYQAALTQSHREIPVRPQ